MADKSMTPPASTEPMYLISESELLVVSEECGFTDSHKRAMKAIRARGPVQRAPSLDEKDRIFVLLSDPETRREIVDRLSQPWSIEVLQEIERIRKEHDAALIAQEREKWEREHTPTFHAKNPESFSPWYNVEMVAARVRRAEAQEREDVLNLLRLTDTGVCPYHKCKSPSTEELNCRDCLLDWLNKSMRSEVGK